MSFFNLTQLGADDTIKASVAITSAPNTTEAGNVNGRRSGSGVSSRFGEAVLPNSEANGSHEKYTTMLQKHQRPPNGIGIIILHFHTSLKWRSLIYILHNF
jgi:hypothetical protein